MNLRSRQQVECRNEQIGDELGAELFDVRVERTYSGEGEMLETESAVVIVEDA